MKMGGTRYTVTFTQTDAERPTAFGTGSNVRTVLSGQITPADGGLWIADARGWCLYPWHRIQSIRPID